MVTIEDNKKLLNMKESFLELAFANREIPYNKYLIVLNEFKDIVISLDKSLYEELVTSIKDGGYETLPLEEKLVFLEKIAKQYDELDKFQTKYKELYKQYSNENLQLSKIGSIQIDNIVKLIDAIGNYLKNKGKIEKNKELLSNFNSELIDEVKKNDVFKERVAALEIELKNNMFNTEGRVYNSLGQTEYSSISKEYMDVGFDLKTLLFDKKILDDEIDKIKVVESELQQKEKAAEICYENNPNSNYKEIYFNIKKEATRARYKLVLLEICELISKTVDNFDSAIDKRERLLDLLVKRNKYLTSLDVRYLYDPFERIAIIQQLDFIKSFDRNVNTIKEIRKKMDDIDSRNDELLEKNREYLDLFSSDISLFDDSKTLDYIIDDLDVYTEHNKIDVMDNQVVAIANIPDGMLIDRILDKTNGVINRVYKLMTGVHEEEEKEITPELIIDSTNFKKELDNEGDSLDIKSEEEIKVDNEEVANPLDNMFLEEPVVFDDNTNYEEEPKKEDVSLDIKPEQTSKDNDEDIINYLEKLFESESVASDKDASVVDDRQDASLSALSEKVKTDDVSVPDSLDEIFKDEPVIFEKSEPFSPTELFADRYDDGSNGLEDFDSKIRNMKIDFSEDGVSKKKKNTMEKISIPIEEVKTDEDVEVEMPNMDDFWVTKDSNEEKEEEKVISFDEQIQDLIGGNKVKKMVS